MISSSPLIQLECCIRQHFFMLQLASLGEVYLSIIRHA